jgi:arylformamidase
MRIYDLSQKLVSGPSQYPEDPPICIQTIKDVQEDGYRLELFSAGSHAGTHVDLPLHLFLDGQSVDMFPVEAFIGQARVFRGSGGIGRKELQYLSSHVEIVLLASTTDQIWLEEEGA